MHNSARSQMAAALVNRRCGDKLIAESAGLAPGKLNPLVVQALEEDGIDISQNQTRSVEDVFRAGTVFDYIVTVCSEAESEGCPVFPGRGERLHWPFDDPSQFTGSEAERLAQTRLVREQIRAHVAQFCDSLGERA
ncbi:MAG: arsenate reductase ArsC [Verrucomicrobiota bacterium]|nr:arsenate reductase ArsC [Verrucomicrobiota bacterium]